MSEFTLFERLIWAVAGGLIAIGLALLVCRIKALHPAIKTWACRLVLLKLAVSLAWALPVVGGEIDQGRWLNPWLNPWLSPWFSPLVAQFLIGAWVAGLLVVAFFGLRAYAAAAKLRRHGQRIDRRKLPVEVEFEVRSVPGLPEPCVVGVFRPTLLIPDGTEIDPAVIHHELAHVNHFDAPFGVLAWVVNGVFWFVPGIGKLLSEQSLWQEVWADLSSRKSLQLDPSRQANALLAAVSRSQELPVAALGYRGDTIVVARRIEAMFVRSYSKGLAILLLLAVALVSVPIGKAESTGDPPLAAAVRSLSRIGG